MKLSFTYKGPLTSQKVDSLIQCYVIMKALHNYVSLFIGTVCQVSNVVHWPLVLNNISEISS